MSRRTRKGGGVRARTIAANTAIVRPNLKAEIMLPPGYTFVEAADYVKVIATRQIKDGRPVIVVHVSVIAPKNLIDPVFVHIEDDPTFERTQVRPVKKEVITRDGFILA